MSKSIQLAISQDFTALRQIKFEDIIVISNFWLKMIIFTIYISIHEIMNLPYDILAGEFAITFYGKFYGKTN